MTECLWAWAFIQSLSVTFRGLTPWAIDGKALAAEFFAGVEAEGPASPFAPISEMFSINPEDAADFAAAEGVDAEPPAVRWHSAADGMQAVREVLSRLRDKNPRSRAIGDLEQIEKVLETAARAGVRFYLTCDMP